MRIALFILMAVFMTGCATADWKKGAAARAGVPEAEVREVIRIAEESQKLPAVSMLKSSENEITVLLSGDKVPHGGTAVHFEKKDGQWVIKDSGPWWE